MTTARSIARLRRGVRLLLDADPTVERSRRFRATFVAAFVLLLLAAPVARAATTSGGPATPLKVAVVPGDDGATLTGWWTQPTATTSSPIAANPSASATAARQSLISGQSQLALLDDGPEVTPPDGGFEKAVATKGGSTVVLLIPNSPSAEVRAFLVWIAEHGEANLPPGFNSVAFSPELTTPPSAPSKSSSGAQAPAPASGKSTNTTPSSRAQSGGAVTATGKRPSASAPTSGAGAPQVVAPSTVVTSSGVAPVLGFSGSGAATGTSTPAPAPAAAAGAVSGPSVVPGAPSLGGVPGRTAFAQPRAVLAAPSSQWAGSTLPGDQTPVALRKQATSLQAAGQISGTSLLLLAVLGCLVMYARYRHRPLS